MKIPTPEQLQYMQTHVNDTKVPGMIVTSVLCMIFATLAVVTRFIARLTATRKVALRSSDWLVLVALIFLAMYVAAFLQSTVYGMGRHIIVVTNPKQLTIWVLVAEITITVSILAVKASICCLYMQIFPLPWIRSTSITIIGVVIAYTIAHIVSDLTQCIPLAALWDPTITNAKCYPFSHQVIAMAIVNIITDIAILLVPMKPIWGLMISRKRKWQLSVILSLGALACIVGGIRIPFVKKMGSADETWDFVPAGIVSMVEPTVAIIAACLPACRPLLSRVFNISLGLKDFYSRPKSFNVFSSHNKSHAFELSNNSKNTGITKESAFEVGSVRSADDEETLVLPPRGHCH